MLARCALITAVLGTLFLPLAIEAQTGKKRSVVIGYATQSGVQSSLWVAKDSGAFEKYGLETQLVWIQGGPRVVQALIAGNIDIGLTGGPDPVRAILGGAQIKIIASNHNRMDATVVAEKSITRPSELRGKKFATGIIGSTGYLRSEFVLRRWGLEPNKDVFLVPLGNTPTRFAALNSGQVSATLVAPPEDYVAKKMGYNILGDLNDVEYLANVAIISKKAEQDPEIVERFLKGLIEGIWFLKTRRDESLKIMQRHLKFKDPEIAGAAYVHYSDVILAKPYPSEKGAQLLLSELEKKDQRARYVKAENFFELKYLKKIEESGFIDSLYQRGR
jgi:ABC-type nitrate/sulfonate/bicarbonate transport system substrate-binding protein